MSGRSVRTHPFRTRDIPELESHLEGLSLGAELGEQQEGAGYIEMRLHDFMTVWEAMASTLEVLGVGLGR